MLKRITQWRPVQVLMAYGQSQGGNYAASLSYNAFLSMFPLILGMLAIVGFIVNDPATRNAIYAGIVSVFPQDAHPQILKALNGVQHNAGILGIVSVVGLLWSGTGLFASMEFALTTIFATTQRDMLRQRGMGLIMVLVFIAAVLFVVGANSALAASPGIGIIGAVAGALALVGLMIAIYRFVPNRTFALREIWPGAVLAGLLVELFSLLFPLYAKVSNGFDTYGRQFFLFFLLAAWLGFMSQFILIGAVFNKMRLGTPQERGIVASPDAKSRDHQDPSAVIESRKTQTAGSNSALQTPSQSVANGSQPGRAPAGHPTPREARVALGVGVAVAAVGMAASRLRKQRSRLTGVRHK
jgi:YihY family inner membrane protein